MQGEVPHEWGEERRGWHIDRTVTVSGVAALFAVAITVIGALGTAVYWYAENETRLADQASMTRELQASDLRQQERMEQQRQRIEQVGERWRSALAAQERRTERRFDQLTNELQGVRKLLERIALNTGKGD